MRRILIVLALATALAAVAGPATAATATVKTEERHPGVSLVTLTHGRQQAVAVVGLDGTACNSKGEGAARILGRAIVSGSGVRVSAESIALIKGAVVVREFKRQQAAGGSVSTNTPAYVPVTAAIYRVRVTIGVRWADGSLSKYTIWTKYSPVIPAC